MKNYYITLTPFFPSPTHFAGSYIYDQVKSIQSGSDFEVIVITTTSSRKAMNYVYQGITVHEIKVVDIPSFIFPGAFNTINLERIVNKLKELTANRLQDIRFIHGHVTYPFGVIAVKLAQKIGAKSIIQHHGFDVMGYTNGRFQKGILKEWNKKWINKFHVPFLNRADWNVGVSLQTLKELHLIKGYEPTKEYVLYNGVDERKFYAVDGLKVANEFTIGCVGNFWEIKDQLTLIKAVALLVKKERLIKIRLKLIGTGITLAKCKAYVGEHDLSNYVSFLPTIDHTELNTFYNSLDLFVLPSYYEAFGCVYTEAHACNVPFIGVEGQGIAELILPENKGYQLVEAKNEVALAEKIKYFYHHPDFKPGLNTSVHINALVTNFLKSILK